MAMCRPIDLLLRTASVGAVTLGLALTALAASPEAPGDAASGSSENLLRVCADPNNMPFSNAREEGFENKLADLVARDLGKQVSYTWWAQRRGFIRETLKAGRCDVILGIPALEMLEPTRPYYSSTYVLVSRARDDLTFSSIEAPELKHLRIGVHLIGDDGANTPAAHVLGQEGLVDNVVGFPIYGDYRQDAPPSRLIEAVETGEIDVAVAWGPLAGYFAQRSPVPLRVTPVTGTEAYLPFVFQFSIGMGVRKDDQDLKEKLNDVIIERRANIDALLDEYGVPRV
jgi:mxaJ protein